MSAEFHQENLITLGREARPRTHQPLSVDYGPWTVDQPCKFNLPYAAKYSTYIIILLQLNPIVMNTPLLNVDQPSRLFSSLAPSSLLVCLWMWITPVASQAQDNELKTFGGELGTKVVAVQSGSKSYEQKASFQEPALVRYSYDEIDQKGNRTNYVYEFNLADIDPYAVREQTQKDLISVVIAARNKQKLIKVYKNDVVQSYDDETTLIAKDIENAREIANLIKKAIPPAEKVMASRLKVSGYDALVNWLVSNVKDVSLGDKSVKQSMKQGEHPGTLVFTRVETDSKSSTEDTYTFNLADVNANTLAYKITGNQFAINFEALQKTKYFGVRKNGQPRPYVNELLISTNGPDEARDLKYVLSTVLPLAAEKVKGSMPAVSSDKDGLQKLAKLTADVTYGEQQVEQSMEEACLTSFTQVEKNPKGSSKSVFKFNWMDVNPLASAIEVSGEKLSVDLKFTDDKNLVMNTTDDKFKGYENRVTLYMPDIESARKAKFVIDKVIEKCKASYKEPFGSDAASAISYFRENIREITLDGSTLKQTVEPVEGESTKFKFTVVEVGSKGSGPEQVYEFNLSDINPSNIAMEAKGKWLYVVMETNFKAKIIKYYKDGKIQPYTTGLEFAVNDVDLARNIVSALKKAVTATKGK